MKNFSIVFAVFLFFAHLPPFYFCQTPAPASSQNKREKIAEPIEIKTETLDLFDKNRNRRVPVALYFPAENSKTKKRKLKLAIFSHGYGMKNTEYSFIAENLAARGYLVTCIQHELPTDEPMPTVGNPSEVRRPHWERGVENILFVISELKRISPKTDYKNLLLAGHSNGGDTTMLFVQKYPELARKVFSLDNRRMSLPRVKRPQILSIRSSDQPADEGVLPNVEEQKEFGIKIIKLQNTTHNDMWDGATDAQKREINKIIADFLIRNL